MPDSNQIFQVDSAPAINLFHFKTKNKSLQVSEQTSADKDSESPDSSALSLSGRTDRQRTEFFLKIRTESGQRTDTGQDFPENPEKNETRTGHGQCCPPTSVSEPLLDSPAFQESI